MAKYLVKLCRSWESACEIEVEANTEQEAIAVVEASEIDEEGWTELEMLEQYVGDVDKVK